MGFFANIPKPPKLAGFFGNEEEKDENGKKMEEIGGEMEDLELKSKEVDIPSSASIEQKLLTPMDLLNAARNGGGGNNENNNNMNNNGQQRHAAPPPMLPPMPGAQHPMFSGQMPPQGPPRPGMPPVSYTHLRAHET